MSYIGRVRARITHKLNEVIKACDKITVLRKGKLIKTVDKSDTDQTKLANMMVGRDVIFRVEALPDMGKTPMVKLENIWVDSDRGLPALKGISFTINEGEILGIAGVAGNGQKELEEALRNLRKVTEGKMFIKGKDLTNKSPQEVINEGVAYIPEERMSTGLMIECSVTDNILLKLYDDPTFCRGGIINYNKINQETRELISEFDVVCSDISNPVKMLSGGNIQKLLISRELSRSPVFLIASQPTRGLDVGATEYVRNRLVEQKSKGTAILLISEDLDEVIMLSDRIAILYEGEIVGIVERKDADITDIGLMMAGISNK